MNLSFILSSYLQPRVICQGLQNLEVSNCLEGAEVLDPMRKPILDAIIKFNDNFFRQLQKKKPRLNWQR